MNLSPSARMEECGCLTYGVVEEGRDRVCYWIVVACSSHADPNICLYPFRYEELEIQL